MNATGPVDPLVRAEPPFDWYRTPVVMPRRVETPGHLPDLDPDIALWPVTPLQRWPFTGAPSEGIWPKGWAGVDNTGTMYVCTVGGQPGTWAQVGSGGGGGWPTVNGTGAGNLTATLGSGDTTGYNFTDNGSGGFNVTAGANSGVTLSAANDIAITQTGIGALVIDQTDAANAQGIVINDRGTVGITLDGQGTGAITIETTGGGATTGIALTTQATDTGGINLTDNGSGGAHVVSAGVALARLGNNGTGGVAVTTAGGGVTTGITIETQASDIGGMTISNVGTSNGIFMFDAAAGITIEEGGAGDIVLNQAGTGHIILTGLPTSAAGLPAGALWNNLGVVSIA
jgi:hypothetical protein